MSYEVLAVSNQWPATAQFTATGETQIALTNRTQEAAFYIVHATRPTDDPYGGMAVLHPAKETLTLLDGESLWIVAPGLEPGESVPDMIFRHY
ncbi:MAG: hypothetical protein AAF825_01975 [Pseudomonadota bacterium]